MNYCCIVLALSLVGDSPLWGSHVDVPPMILCFGRRPTLVISSSQGHPSGAGRQQCLGFIAIPPRARRHRLGRGVPRPHWLRVAPVSSGGALAGATVASAVMRWAGCIRVSAATVRQPL